MNIFWTVGKYLDLYFYVLVQVHFFLDHPLLCSFWLPKAAFHSMSYKAYLQTNEFIIDRCYESFSSQCAWVGRFEGKVRCLDIRLDLCSCPHSGRTRALYIQTRTASFAGLRIHSFSAGWGVSKVELTMVACLKARCEACLHPRRLLVPWVLGS